MNWVTESLLMFVCSALLYITVRKASLLKIPTEINNLAMFFVPVIGFICLLFFSKPNLFLTFPELLFMLIVAIVFSYFGNLFSLKSIEKAPNPGYSLIISKSYVVFTTVVTVFFFHSPITIPKVIAICCIVFFSALILAQNSTKKNLDHTWFFYAIGAFFCWGLLSLSAKYFYLQGISVLTFLTYLFLLVSLCIIFQIKKQHIPLDSIKKYPIVFIMVGLFSFGFNFFQFDAISIAPNLGYVNAINASSISLVTILSIFLLKDEFSLRKFIGVIGTTIGLIILLM